MIHDKRPTFAVLGALLVDFNKKNGFQVCGLGAAVHRIVKLSV